MLDGVERPVPLWRQRGARWLACPPRLAGLGGRQAVVVASALIVLAGVLAVVLVGSQLDVPAERRLPVNVMAMLGAAGFIAAGLLARRRPSTRGVSLLMLVAGCAWVLSGLRYVIDDRAVFTIGILGAWLWAVVLGHLALAFPSGRLTGRPSRLVIGAAYLLATVAQASWVLLAGRATFAGEECPRCPLPILSLGQRPELATSVIRIERLLAGAAAIAVAVLLARRWRTASSVQRRSLAPVLAAGAVTALCFAVSQATNAAHSEHAGGALEIPAEAGFVVLPFAFLAGVWLTRIQRTFGASRFVEQLDRLPGPDHLAASLASALGDETLTVVYWLPDSGYYVDRDGRAVALPVAGSGHAVTHVDLDGHHVAALVHDAALCEEADAVRAAGRAAALWLERDRLEAERRAYIADLRESRARLVAASDTQRRRIERDLHDGAQQRLAAMLFRMKLERRAVHGDARGQAALLDELETGLTAAVEELRALAAGILPPVLTDRGLDAALEELAARSPVPVTLDHNLHHRPAERVEVAAYFVAAEALANVAKHSHAQHASISTRRSARQLIIEIADDGHGGATLEGGSGLRGLADRVGALDGRLTVHSPPGGGTRLRAELPCES